MKVQFGNFFVVDGKYGETLDALIQVGEKAQETYPTLPGDAFEHVFKAVPPVSADVFKRQTEALAATGADAAKMAQRLAELEKQGLNLLQREKQVFDEFSPQAQVVTPAEIVAGNYTV